MRAPGSPPKRDTLLNSYGRAQQKLAAQGALVMTKVVTKRMSFAIMSPRETLSMTAISRPMSLLNLRNLTTTLSISFNFNNNVFFN